MDCLFAASTALVLIELMAPVNYYISYLLDRFLPTDYVGGYAGLVSLAHIE
jgi:hypothetical protein